MIIRYVFAQPGLAYEKNQWKTEFLFLVPFFCLRNIFASNDRSTLGVSLSLNSHTCIHRGNNASDYHSHLFLDKCLTIWPTTCLSCPSLCLCYQIYEQ